MFMVGLLEGIGISFIVPLLQQVIPSGDGLVTTGNKVTMLFTSLFELINVNLTLANVLIFTALIFVVQSGVKFGQLVLVADLHSDFHKRLMTRLYGVYLKAEWPFFYKNKTGFLINNITLETERAASAVQFFSKLLSECCVATIYFSIALLISWKLTLGSIFMAFTVMVLVKNILKRAFKLGTKQTEYNNLVQSEVGDKLAAIKIIKASATEERVNNSFLGFVDQKIKYRFHSLVNSSLIPTIFLPSLMAIICSAIYICFTFLKMEFSLIVLFLFIFYRLMPRFQAMQNAFHEFLIYVPALNEVQNSIDKASEVEEKVGSKEFKGLKQEAELVEAKPKNKSEYKEKVA